MGGRVNKSIIFADDKTIVYGSEMGLQKIVNSLNRTAEEHKMRINKSKTKMLRIAKKEGISI